MTIRSPKQWTRTGIYLAIIHLVYATCLFAGLKIYAYIHGGQDEGYPFVFLVMYTVLAILDYPVFYIVEKARTSNLALSIGIAIFAGTLMWFVVGVAIQKSVSCFKRNKITS